MRSREPLQSLSQAKHATQVSLLGCSGPGGLMDTPLVTVPGQRVRSGAQIFLFLACSQPPCQLSTSHSAIKVGRGGSALAGASPAPPSLPDTRGFALPLSVSETAFLPCFPSSPPYRFCSRWYPSLSFPGLASPMVHAGRGDGSLRMKIPWEVFQNSIVITAGF